MKSVAQLKSEILTQIFPSGAPENLKLSPVDGVKSPLDMIFDEALAEIAKWVPCEQERNVDVVDFAETFFKCGMTVYEQPHGVIKRVFTVAEDTWCDPVFYIPREWPAPEVWGRMLLTQWVDPANSGIVPVLPNGLKRAEDTTDRDENGTMIGRARTGIYAIDDEKVYVAPWLQSNEQLVIEWRGIKKTWRDEDQVNDDLDYRKAVKLYVQYAYERDYGDSKIADTLHNIAKSGMFDEALGDLMWQCRERTKQSRHEPEPEEALGVPQARWAGETTDTVITEEDTCVTMNFAGEGSPEGVVTAPPGSTYVDTLGSGFWVKFTGTGNTGWVQLIS